MVSVLTGPTKEHNLILTETQSAGGQDSYAAGGGYEDRGGESRGRGRGGGRGGMGGRGGGRGGGSGGPGSRDAYVHK